MRPDPIFRASLGILLAIGLSGCATAVIRLRPVPSGAQGISLLGDTLWTVPIAPGDGPPLVQLLHAAQRNLQSRPTDVAARILVARRTAALGRLREAIDLYTAIIAEAPEARVYRRRGELLLLIRELRLADRDLRRAVKNRDTKTEREFAEDPSGRLQSTSLGYQANLLLGLTRYVRGEHPKAVTSLVEALRFSEGPDELAESGFWLTAALFRAGRTAEAAEVIRKIPGTLEVRHRGPELSLLRFFKGELSVDSLRERALGEPHEEILYLYGLGLTQLIRGDRGAAADLFEEAARRGIWHGWGAIAAESELVRLRGPGDQR